MSLETLNHRAAMTHRPSQTVPPPACHRKSGPSPTSQSPWLWASIGILAAIATATLLVLIIVIARGQVDGNDDAAAGDRESEVASATIDPPATAQSDASVPTFDIAKTLRAAEELSAAVNVGGKGPKGWSAVEPDKWMAFVKSRVDAVEAVDCQNVDPSLAQCQKATIELYRATHDFHECFKTKPIDKSKVERIKLRIKQCVVKLSETAKRADQRIEELKKRSNGDTANANSVAADTRHTARRPADWPASQSPTWPQLRYIDSPSDWAAADRDAKYIGEHELFASLPPVRLVVDADESIRSHADERKLRQAIEAALRSGGIKLDPASPVKIKATYKSCSRLWRSVTVASRYNLARTNNQSEIHALYFGLDIVSDLPVLRDEGFVKMPVSLLGVYTNTWVTGGLDRDHSPERIVGGLVDACMKYFQGLQPTSVEYATRSDRSRRELDRNRLSDKTMHRIFYRACRENVVPCRRPLDDVKSVRPPEFIYRMEADKFVNDSKLNRTWESSLRRCGIGQDATSRLGPLHILTIEEGYFSKAGEMLGWLGRSHRFYAYTQRISLKEPVAFWHRGQMRWTDCETMSEITPSVSMSEDVRTNTMPIIINAVDSFPNATNSLLY
jgi:hypothetical protein